jgi:hypothetical protein
VALGAVGFGVSPAGVTSSDMMDRLSGRRGLPPFKQRALIRMRHPTLLAEPRRVGCAGLTRISLTAA